MQLLVGLSRKRSFYKKYQDYCRDGDTHKEDIFRISQREDEPLEDYIDRFQFSLMISKQNRLTPKSLRLVFLRGVNEE